jgi:hypothetical protein
VGVLGESLAYAWLSFWAEKQARIQERLTLIAELNHHVRNSLAVIALAASGEDENRRAASTQEAVDRIDWVLRELVPTAADAKGRPRLLGQRPPSS